MKRKPIVTACQILIPALSVAPAFAEDVTMATGNVSWLNADTWSNNEVPTAANDYFTAVLDPEILETGVNTLRSSPAGSTAGGDADFPGNSLTIVSGTRFLGKQQGDQTASINGGDGDLILDGGRFSFGPNGGANPTMDVNQFVVTSTPGSLIDPSSVIGTLTFDGTLTGEGDLLLRRENGDNTKTITFTNIENYTGALTVQQTIQLDFNVDYTFTNSLTLEESGTLIVDQTYTFDEGDLSDPVNGVILAGTYSGDDLFDLGENYVEDGGTIIVNPVDTDDDGLPDFYENLIIDADPDDDITSFDDVAGPDDAPTTTDFDDDGLSDAEEFELGTDPLLTDTDGDGLSDAVEDNGGTFVSEDQTGTDPNVADTDEDGFDDATEVFNGSDPLDSNDTPILADLEVVNGGFEDPIINSGEGGASVSEGEVIGWTEVENDFYVVFQDNFTGGTNPPGAFEGLQFATGSIGATTPGTNAETLTGGIDASMSMAQDIDLSAYSAEIDNESEPYGVALNFNVYDNDVSDQGIVTLTFLDEGGNDLGRSATFGTAGNPGEWVNTSLTGFPPVGTRTVRIELAAIKIGTDSSSSRNVAYDDVSAYIANLDNDDDGLPNAWEELYGLDLNDDSDAGISSDDDTLTNLEEFQAGTDPTLADTDGDGINDDVEIDNGTDPLVPDAPAAGGIQVVDVTTTTDANGQVTTVSLTFSGLDTAQSYQLTRGTTLQDFPDVISTEQPTEETFEFQDDNPIPAETSDKAFYRLIEEE